MVAAGGGPRAPTCAGWRNTARTARADGLDYHWRSGLHGMEPAVHMRT